MHIRLINLDKQEAYGRINRNFPRFGAFSDDLLMHLRFWRHINYDIALNRCLTPESAALWQATNAVIAFFNRIPFAQRFRP